MGLSQPIPTPICPEDAQFIDLESHLEYFSHSGHKPVLLIDGMLESVPDRVFLQQTCDSIAEPKKCITLPNADHYANVANFGPIVIYDQQVVGQLVPEIDLWLSGN